MRLLRQRSSPPKPWHALASGGEVTKNTREELLECYKSRPGRCSLCRQDSDRRDRSLAYTPLPCGHQPRLGHQLDDRVHRAATAGGARQFPSPHREYLHRWGHGTGLRARRWSKVCGASTRLGCDRSGLVVSVHGAEVLADRAHHRRSRRRFQLGARIKKDWVGS